MCQGFSHFSGFLHHLILAKLATSSIRVNPFILTAWVSWGVLPDILLYTLQSHNLGLNCKIAHTIKPISAFSEGNLCQIEYLNTSPFKLNKQLHFKYFIKFMFYSLDIFLGIIDIMSQ